MRRWVDGLRSSKPSPFFRSHPGMNCLRNGLSDFTLHGENTRQVAVVTLSPYVGIRGRMDELRHDSDLAASAQHASFDDAVHTQFSCNLRERLVRALVAHRRSTRDHLQCPDLGEIGDQRLGHTVREVGLLDITREVCERQYCKGADARAPAENRAAMRSLNPF